MMKVIIAGSRSCKDYHLLKTCCDHFLHNCTDVEIVSGTAHGADQLGEKYAAENGYAVKRFPAEWSKHGKGAGWRRNKQMAEYSDALIAFWDGCSKGTKIMIDLAEKMNLKIKVIRI